VSTPLGTKQLKNNVMIVQKTAGAQIKKRSKDSKSKTKKSSNIIISSKRPATQPTTALSSSQKLSDMLYTTKYLLSPNRSKYKIQGIVFSIYFIHYM